jgi:hypothetical protein
MSLSWRELQCDKKYTENGNVIGTHRENRNVMITMENSKKVRHTWIQQQYNKASEQPNMMQDVHMKLNPGFQWEMSSKTLLTSKLDLN